MVRLLPRPFLLPQFHFEALLLQQSLPEYLGSEGGHFLQRLLGFLRDSFPPVLAAFSHPVSPRLRVVVFLLILLVLFVFLVLFPVHLAISLLRAPFSAFSAFSAFSTRDRLLHSRRRRLLADNKASRGAEQLRVFPIVHKPILVIVGGFDKPDHILHGQLRHPQPPQTSVDLGGRKDTVVVGVHGHVRLPLGDPPAPQRLSHEGRLGPPQKRLPLIVELEDFRERRFGDLEVHASSHREHRVEETLPVARAPLLQRTHDHVERGVGEVHVAVEEAEARLRLERLVRGAPCVECGASHFPPGTAPRRTPRLGPPAACIEDDTRLPVRVVGAAARPGEAAVEKRVAQGDLRVEAGEDGCATCRGDVERPAQRLGLGEGHRDPLPPVRLGAKHAGGQHGQEPRVGHDGAVPEPREKRV